MKLNFDEVELLLSRLLETAAPVLSKSECAEVQDFIDVGEYGLVLKLQLPYSPRKERLHLPM